MFYVYLSFSIFTVVMDIVLGVITIISGNRGGWSLIPPTSAARYFLSPDLPAVAKLLCCILQKHPSVASTNDHSDHGNEEDVLIGDKVTGHIPL